MKKIFVYIGIFLILFGVFVPVFVNAQNAGSMAGVRLPGQATTTDKAAPQTGSPQSGGGCTTLSWSISGCLISFLGWVGFYLMQFTAWLMSLTGIFLNWVMRITILDMSKNINGMTGINVAWKVIRDLINIVFIFLLLYEGIKMILGMQNTEGIKKFIGFIILASLLVNFSLFFTKVIIDTSNIVTIGFYNSIIDPADAANGKGLSNAYMGAIGLQGFFSGGSFDSFKSSVAGSDDMKMLIIGLCASVLFLITTYAFLVVTFMFILRYLILIFLLMLSPIGYMGMALPALKKSSSEWWETLRGQCIFGPLYMLATWIILTLISMPGFIAPDWKSGDWVGAITKPINEGTQTTNGSLGLFLNFALVMAAIIMSLKQTQKYSNQGSTMIKDFGGKLTSFAGGVALGGAGVLGRNVIGRVGATIAESERAKNWAAQGKFGGKALLNVSNKAAGSTFDARNTYVGGQFAKGFGTGAGINLGKGTDKKTNFKAIRDERIKKEEDFAKTLKPSDEEVNRKKEKLGSEISSDKFKAEEAKRKDDYFNSDEYKNSEEGKKEMASIKEGQTAKENYEKSLKQAEADKKALEELEEKKKRAGSREEEREIQSEINSLNAKKTEREKEIAKLKGLYESKEKAMEAAKKSRDGWKSETMKEMEDRLENMSRKIYEERIDQYADSLESTGSKVKMWAMNAARVVPSSLGGGILGAAGTLATPNVMIETPGDRKMAASRVRKLKKEKSNAEKIADLVRQQQKEEDAKNKKEDSGMGEPPKEKVVEPEKNNPPTK